MKCLAVEWLGWGIPVDTPPDNILREVVSGTVNKGTPAEVPRGGDVPWFFTMADASGLAVNMFVDAFFQTGQAVLKFATYIVVAIEGDVLTCRLVEFAGQGATWWRGTRGTGTIGDTTANLPTMRLHFYIPRLTTSDGIILESGLPQLEGKRVWDDSLLSWTTQLRQQAPARGGINSSSGFSVTIGFDGDEARNQSDLEDPENDLYRHIEVLLSGLKLPFGAVPDATFPRNRGVSLSGNLAWFGGRAQLSFGPGSNGPPDPADDVSLYWGSVQTDRAEVFSNSFASIPGVYGSDYLLITPSEVGIPGIFELPSGIAPYRRPPGVAGRRVRLWVIDFEPGQPGSLWGTEETKTVFSGYTTTASLSNSATAVTITIADALTALRENRNLGPPSVREDEPAFAFRGGSAADPNVTPQTTLEDYSRGPFNVEMIPRGFEFPSTGRVIPFWTEIGGWAFPTSSLTRVVSGDRLRRFQICRARPREGLDAADVTYEIENQRFRGLWVEKYGIAVEPDEEFTWGTLSEDDSGRTERPQDVFLQPFTIRIDDTFGATTRFNNDPSIQLPAGYAAIFSRPDQAPWDFLTIGAAPFTLDLPPEYYITGVLQLLLPQAGNLSPRDQAVGSSRKSLFAVRSFTDLRLNPLVRENAQSLIHVFIPSVGSSGHQVLQLFRASLDQVGIEYSASPAMTISALDLILQLLTSRGAAVPANTGNYEVMPGINGPWDLVPRPFALGVPVGLVDWESILDDRFRTPTGEISQAPALDQILLTNTYMRQDDLGDPAKWLEENVLTPYGIVLTSDARGNLISFQSDVSPVVTLETIEFQDLHSDDPDAAPSVSWDAREDNFLSGASLSFLDPNGVVLDTLRPFPGFPTRDVIQSASQSSWQNAVGRDRKRENIKTTLRARPAEIGAAMIGTHSGGSGMEETFALEYAPPPLDLETLSSVSTDLEEYGLFLTRLRLTSFVVPGIDPDFLGAVLTSRVLRWSLPRPRVSFAVNPGYPDIDALQPGRSVSVELYGVGIDGQKEMTGVVLIDSVSRTLDTGVVDVLGHFFSAVDFTGEPFGNLWALSVPVNFEDPAGPIDELRLDVAGGAETLRLNTTLKEPADILTPTVGAGMYCLFLDEYFQVLGASATDDPVMTEYNAQTRVATFVDYPWADSTEQAQVRWVVLSEEAFTEDWPRKRQLFFSNRNSWQ